MKKLFGLLLALCFYTNSNAVTKVACIGASITYGATVNNREQNSFPAHLQKYLGDGYAVENYGVSGTTLLRNGDSPYYKTNEYQKALASNPDIVVIDLGGNDSKLINRSRLNEYEQDYHAMIKSFKDLPSHPRIILLLPVVSFVTDTTGIWDPVIVKQIIPKIKNVARENKVEILDMHALLVNKPDLMPDKIHPDAEGSRIMAERIYKMIKFNK
nr:GDSL-type esterase/lipase family protein [Pedobacter panaciterrae]